jgi:hypothetical protein
MTLSLVSWRVGKYNLLTNEPSYFTDHKIRDTGDVNHRFAVCLEWEITDYVTRIQVTRITVQPVSNPKVKYYSQEWVGNELSGGGVFEAMPAMFKHPLQLVGYYCEPKNSYYQPPPEVICTSTPFTLRSTLKSYDQRCAICLDDEDEPLPIPPHSPMIPVVTMSHWPVSLTSKLQTDTLQKYQQECKNLDDQRLGRTVELDCYDVLFCGHAFHRQCMDGYRAKQERGVKDFDVPCPTCKMILAV